MEYVPGELDVVDRIRKGSLREGMHRITEEGEEYAFRKFSCSVKTVGLPVVKAC